MGQVRTEGRQDLSLTLPLLSLFDILPLLLQLLFLNRQLTSLFTWNKRTSSDF
jgi:hypothetical protein